MGARYSVSRCPRSWSGAEDRSEPIEMGKRGPQKSGREIPGSPGNRGGGVRISWGGVGCMGAEGPSSSGIAHLCSAPRGPALQAGLSQLGRVDDPVELLLAKAPLPGELANGAAGAVRFLGHLGGLVVADHRSERGR